MQTKLSKLQKAILVWLGEVYQDESARDTWERIGVPVGYRPSFYGGGPLLHTPSRRPHAKFGWNESQAFSLSIRRLEERGLIERIRPSWHHNGKRTKYIKLTAEGEDTAGELIKAGVTSKVKNKPAESLAAILAAVERKNRLD